ncbi:rod shape-determining protein [Streptomyces smyrnaeus]|uniref:rod shape-determining protein n=1 Tax=Streptomyces TaxID=1883 RepID=UPI000C187F21|nr:rod shape-determining protein [Streptomyces sp. RK75]MBQ0866896.1 rod shape-determining protein [Streptomyces sp. RK75]MBQ1159504.1 rod shape-determining protein [Streptomyces sp. A73]
MTIVRRSRYTTTSGHRQYRPWPLGRQRGGLALEVGSARTRAWVSGRGMILDVPTVTFPGTAAVHPVQRGAIVDVPGTARMLDRLLGHRLPRLVRPLVVITTPVLDGPAYRERVRKAVEVLRPRAVLTVPTARAVALAAGADRTRPLLVVDVGAHLTEVVLLAEGAVFDARRTALGTIDLPDAGDPSQITEAVSTMIASMLRQDGTSLTADALSQGALLAGGGALLPGLTRQLIGSLQAPLRAVPAPHTAAIRGAAALLRSVEAHPPPTGLSPPTSGPGLPSP